MGAGVVVSSGSDVVGAGVVVKPAQTKPLPSLEQDAYESTLGHEY